MRVVLIHGRAAAMAIPDLMLREWSDALRFGLLAITACLFALNLLVHFPLTLKFSAWYLGIGLIAPLAILALAVWAFYSSLGGQKVFQGSLLED